jgi:hypothetical protein
MAAKARQPLTNSTRLAPRPTATISASARGHRMAARRGPGSRRTSAGEGARRPTGDRGFPPYSPAARVPERRLSTEFPQASSPGRGQPLRDGRPIRPSGRSLLTSARCQRAPLAQLAEQRTLNPRVRGSSPWRRTHDDLGFSPLQVIFMCLFCPRGRSVVARAHCARAHGPSNPGLVKNGLADTDAGVRSGPRRLVRSLRAPHFWWHKAGTYGG